MADKFATALLFSLFLALLPRGADGASDERNDVVGENRVYLAHYEDTLPRLARRFNVGFVELMAANPGIDPWLPGEGREILVPAAHLLPDGPRKGIVINLSDLRLYYFRRDGSILTYPVGIGRDYWETPEIRSSIVLKRKDPTWRPPASIRREKPDLPAQIGPGPDNPLGAFAMNLGHGAYVIHGTNKPMGVGRRVSHGCIRLYPEDIENLFTEVRRGTPVRIIHQEIKIGWYRNELYLEAHPSQEQADDIEAGRVPEYSADIPAVMDRLSKLPDADRLKLDWGTIERALLERRGVPVQITRSGGTDRLPPLD